MKKQRKSEIVITVKAGMREEFFAQGKRVAKRLDNGEKVAFSRTICFEDPTDLVKFLTKAKLILLAAIRKKPDSISKLASKLHRSRAAVDKDVQMLESIGIVESEYLVNPGHGRCKIVRAIDSNPIRLHVEAII